MARPTSDPPVWATDPTADIEEPSAQRKALGWVARLIPPAGYWNWWMNLIAEWVAYLAETYPVFETLEDAYDNLDDGAIGWVQENDQDKILGLDEFGSGGGTAATACDALAVSGTHLFYAEGGGHPKMVARGDIGTVARTFTKTSAGTVARLLFARFDGTSYILAAYGQYVEAWNADTGVSVWNFNHGATVYDLAYQEQYVCLAGATGTGPAEVRALDVETGAAIWSYDNNGGTAYSCCAIPGRFVFAGNASGHASAANMRALRHTTGADAANEGGTGLDSTGLAWDKVQTNQSTEASLAGDRTGLWWIDQIGERIRLLDPTNGDVLESHDFPAGWDTRGIAVDQDLVLVAVDEGGLGTGWCYALEKRSLRPRWRWKFDGDPVRHVASDGCAVFVGVEGSPALPLHRLYRGNRAQLFRRTAIGGSGSELYQIPAHLVTWE